MFPTFVQCPVLCEKKITYYIFPFPQSPARRISSASYLTVQVMKDMGSPHLNFSWPGPEDHDYVFWFFSVNAISHTNTKSDAGNVQFGETGLVGMALSASLEIDLVITPSSLFPPILFIFIFSTLSPRPMCSLSFTGVGNVEPRLFFF